MIIYSLTILKIISFSLNFNYNNIPEFLDDINEKQFSFGKGIL